MDAAAKTLTASCAKRSSSTWAVCRAASESSGYGRAGAVLIASPRSVEPDPLRGGTVIAIFDMGPHQPFVVCRQQQPGSRDGFREILGCNAYSV